MGRVKLMSAQQAKSTNAYKNTKKLLQTNAAISDSYHFFFFVTKRSWNMCVCVCARVCVVE